VVRWLAPAAAVAAVIGVITGVSVASRGPGELATTTLPGASSQAPEASGPVPDYYVTLDETDSVRGITNYAVVHKTSSGAVLARVTFPAQTVGGGVTAPNITAADDDLTYVIGEFGGPGLGVTKFLLLKVAADGRSAKLSTLPLGLPASWQVDAMAMSPDGKRLAIGAGSCRGADHCTETIHVVTLATGATGNWAAPAHSVGFSLCCLSWVGNRHVLFDLQGGTKAGYRLLSVAGKGGNLLAAPSMSVLPAQPRGYTPPVLLTPDGRAIITSIVENVAGQDMPVAEIAELSASTGKLIRVLRTMPASAVYDASGAASLDGDCRVDSLGPAGFEALVECPGFGRLNGDGRFTPLAGVPDLQQKTFSGPYIWGTGAW